MSEPIESVEAAEPETAETPPLEFKGETFKPNPDVSEWTVLEFAEAADAGEDAGTFRGMASLLRFVVELVHPDDRTRFRALCRRERVGAGDLYEFLFGSKLEDAAERPTVRSSDSSDGPTGTDLKSAASSGDKVSLTGGLALLKGRPDLQVAVEEAARRAS